MRFIQFILACLYCLLLPGSLMAYTHQDTLRGSNGIGRSWWDVQHYSLDIIFDTAIKSISGSNNIILKITDAPHDSLQIDLQEPMVLDSVIYGNLDSGTYNPQRLAIAHEGNVWWVKYPFHNIPVGSQKYLVCFYHGQPRAAIHPPWDGGFIWTTDSLGKPWIAVACQGLGASVWWPCKDAQWDEPDKGQDMTFTLPANLECVSNGHLMEQRTLNNGMTRWDWQVKNPIDNYDVTFYIGDYVHWSDTMMGEKGELPLDFYALRYNEAKARKQFSIVKPMLHCFEYWMGPYPFYEDGYKLVEAPYLGMEHQSAVAYGNKYQMGYLGKDRSGTGIGLTFDYIIVHESGHEWFGNNVTAQDIADNWIHEGITTWSETLFVDCMMGKETAGKYSRGNWSEIQNDKPLIGQYGVNNEGSGDIYRKGAAMMYMIRAVMNNDEKFRQMMRGLSDSFYHKTITTTQAEDYISSYLPDLQVKPFFNQYLRTVDIPELEFYVKKRRLYFRFTHIVEGFTLPIQISNATDSMTITPSADWQSIRWNNGDDVVFGKGLLITIKNTY